jgi:hypothetical protein
MGQRGESMSCKEILSGRLKRTPEAEALADARRNWYLARYEVDQAWRLLRDAEALEATAWRNLKAMETAKSSGTPAAAA